VDEDLRELRSKHRKAILDALPSSLQDKFRRRSGRRPGSGGGGGGGGGCLAAGTGLLCPSGQRLIEDLRVGDDLLSYDPETRSLITARIAAIRHLDDVQSLVLNGTWTTSPQQRILVADGTWMEIGGLRRGLQIASVSGESITVDTIVDGPRTRVFELRTDHATHNVVSAGAILHNVKMRID